MTFEEKVEIEEKRKKHEIITVQLIEKDARRKMNTWYLHFPGKIGPALAYQAVHKRDWNRVRLSPAGRDREGKTRDVPVSVSKGELPEDRRINEVNMRNVIVCRKRLVCGFSRLCYCCCCCCCCWWW